MCCAEMLTTKVITHTATKFVWRFNLECVVFTKPRSLTKKVSLLVAADSYSINKPEDESLRAG